MKWFLFYFYFHFLHYFEILMTSQTTAPRWHTITRANYQRVNLEYIQDQRKAQKGNLGRRLEEFNEEKLTCIKSDLVLTWQMLSAAATRYVIRDKQWRVTFCVEHGNLKRACRLFHRKKILFLKLSKMTAA